MPDLLVTVKGRVFYCCGCGQETDHVVKRWVPPAWYSAKPEAMGLMYVCYLCGFMEDKELTDVLVGEYDVHPSRFIKISDNYVRSRHDRLSLCALNGRLNKIPRKVLNALAGTNDLLEKEGDCKCAEL